MLTDMVKVRSWRLPLDAIHFQRSNEKTALREAQLSFKHSRVPATKRGTITPSRWLSLMARDRRGKNTRFCGLRQEADRQLPEPARPAHEPRSRSEQGYRGAAIVSVAHLRAWLEAMPAEDCSRRFMGLGKPARSDLLSGFENCRPPSVAGVHDKQRTGSPAYSCPAMLWLLFVPRAVTSGSHCKTVFSDP
jgi:hypothetical protein